MMICFRSVRVLISRGIQTEFKPSHGNLGNRLFLKNATRSKTTNITSLLNREAEKFLNNLDSDMIEKKHQIEVWIELLKEKDNKIPSELSPKHWERLLTECNSIGSVAKYLRYVFLTEMSKRNKAEKKTSPLPKVWLERNCPYGIMLRKEHKHYSYIRPYLHGQPLIFDLDYDCEKREETTSRYQLEEAYGDNMIHPEGFQLHFTSLHKHSELHLMYQNGLLDTMLAYFHEKPFWELFPRDKLVYLCPDAPMLRHYDGKSIYVIGGLVDIKHSPRKNSYAKAKELGIRAASLPINQLGFGSAKSSHLPLQHMMRIMLNLNLTGGDFVKAFRETFSPRKFSSNQIKTQSAQEQMIKKKKMVERYLRNRRS